MSLSSIRDLIARGALPVVLSQCAGLAFELGDVASEAYFLFQVCDDANVLRETIETRMSGLPSVEVDALKYNVLKRWERSRVWVPRDPIYKNTSQFVTGSAGAFATLLKDHSDRVERLRKLMFNSEGQKIHDPKCEQIIASFDETIFGLRTICDKMLIECTLYVSKYEVLVNQDAPRAGNTVTEYVLDISSKIDANIHRKLQDVASFLVSDDISDYSLASTLLRQAILSLADKVYPPQESDVKCHDGVVRKMGSDQFVNRLREYFATCVIHKGSNSLARTQVELMGNFCSAANTISSKGVHGEISRFEVMQAYISFLGVICATHATGASAL